MRETDIYEDGGRTGGEEDMEETCIQGGANIWRQNERLTGFRKTMVLRGRDRSAVTRSPAHNVSFLWPGQ